ncbi:MAG TPA: hypothetical protein VLG37_01370 [Candidatus Saccharimonadales bacterium]|nr:hypothetical protein [Candidatus Saccharimonadales bacterium]
MKNKNLQPYQDKRRPLHERLGALVLAGATLFSMASLASRETLAHREVALVQPANPLLHVSEIIERENENERLTVKFDDGLRPQTTSGT